MYNDSHPDLGFLKWKIRKENKMKFKVKKNLTLPLLKPTIDTPFYVRIETPMTKSKVKPKKGEEPPTVCEVTNLETGEQMIMICGAVIENTFMDEYEADSYVGRCFQITKHKISGSQKFNAHTIIEIEPEE